MGSFRVGGSAAAPAAIPGNAAKLVQELKEIVRRGDDEIYAMLKECNMDPNETAQRLLSQDTFLEVRRKRDKRKEAGPKVVAAEAQFPASRGGRVTGYGSGRGNFLQRLSSSEATDARVQPPPPRENGVYNGSRGPHSTLSSPRTYYKPKAVSTGNSLDAPSSHPSSLVEKDNGSTSTHYPGPKHATASVEKVKHLNSSFSTSLNSVDSVPGLFPVPENGNPVKTSRATAKAVEEVGIAHTPLPTPRDSKSDTRAVTSSIVGSSSSKENRAQRLPLNSKSVKDRKPNDSLSAAEVKQKGSSLLRQSVSGRRGMSTGPKYGARVMFQPGPQRARSGLEWKVKSVPSKSVVSQSIAEISLSVVEDAQVQPPSHPLKLSGIVSVPTSKAQTLRWQDDRPVIIPDHLQVPKSEMNGLCFGSFGQDFVASLTPDFSREDDRRGSPQSEDNYSNEEPIDRHTPPRITDLMEPPSHQKMSEQASRDILSPLPSSAESSPKEEVNYAESEPSTMPNTDYAYLPNEPSHEGLEITQNVVNPSSYELEESPTSGLPNYMPQSEPSSFFNPVLRGSSEGSGEDYNSQALLMNSSSRHGGGISIINGQSLNSATEVRSPSRNNISGQAMPGVGLTLPLPIHAYPTQHTGVQFSPFGTSFYGYQYVSPGYTYMQPSYQHGFSGNSVYTSGSSYSPATYTAVGGTPMKYPLLPQFKLPNVIGNMPHSAYAANYTAAPSGFTLSPTASGYDEVVNSGPQYKESNMYVSSQQHPEGSALLIQAPRDMQSTSFYNMVGGQAQHTGGVYSHSQPTNGHPSGAVYGTLYHPSQTAPTAHSLLHQQQQQQQQQQGLIGSPQAGGGGAYQHTQRSQINWRNSY